MRHELLLVRITDRSGALERVLGLIRRKRLPVRQISPLPASDGVQEVLLRYDPGAASLERLSAELHGLADVRASEPMPEAEGPTTRQLALAQVAARKDGPLADVGRVLARSSAGVIVELTGTPPEIDAALDRLREAGILTRATRTGEVPVPELTQGPAEAAPEDHTSRVPGPTGSRVEKEEPEHE